MSKRCVLAFMAIAISSLPAFGDSKRSAEVNLWRTCLDASFKANEKNLADRNAVAEMAFAACKTEEEQVWESSRSVGMPRSSFLRLKLGLKSGLVRP
jgi:hypothetical protein